MSEMEMQFALFIILKVWQKMMIWAVVDSPVSKGYYSSVIHWKAYPQKFPKAMTGN